MSRNIRSYSLLIFLFGLSSLPAVADVELAAAEVPAASSAASSVVAPTLEEHQPPPADEEAKANIITPVDGAILKAMTKKNKLKYEITGFHGYHGQLYIDGKKSEFLTKPVGTEKLAELPAGNYELCVQALNKSHLEVGVPDCVKVSVQ